MKLTSISYWTASILALLAKQGVAGLVGDPKEDISSQVGAAVKNMSPKDNLRGGGRDRLPVLQDYDDSLTKSLSFGKAYADVVKELIMGDYSDTETQAIISHFRHDHGFSDLEEHEHMVQKGPKQSGSVRKLREGIDGEPCTFGNWCVVNSVCIFNSTAESSFDCVCDRANGWMGDGKRKCVDYDECANAYPCAPKDEGGFCVDYDPDAPDFPKYKCGCRRGFRNGTLIDPVHGPLSCKPNEETNLVPTDECTNGDHDCDRINGICTDTFDSFRCSCKEPYTLSDDNSCLLPEAVVGTDCPCVPEKEVCGPNDRCICAPGFFSPSGFGGECQLASSCKAGNGGCDVNAVCRERPTDILCICKNGFSGNGQTCSENDECNTPGFDTGCDVNADCINTVGSYVCSCAEGYSGNGNTCTDVDECSTNTNNCDPNASCSNTVGSFTCTCNAQFSGDGKTCTAIPPEVEIVPSRPVLPALPCSSSKTNNCHPSATCTNTAKGFSCACNSDLVGDGVTCRKCDLPFEVVGMECRIRECVIEIDYEITSKTASNEILSGVEPVDRNATVNLLVKGDFDIDANRVSIQAIVDDGTAETADNQIEVVQSGSVTRDRIMRSLDVRSCKTIPEAKHDPRPIAADRFNTWIRGSNDEITIRVNPQGPNLAIGDCDHLAIIRITTFRDDGYTERDDETCQNIECFVDKDCDTGQYCVSDDLGDRQCKLPECATDKDCVGKSVCLLGEVPFFNRCYSPADCEDGNPGRMFMPLADERSATQLDFEVASETSAPLSLPARFNFFFADYVGGTFSVNKGGFLTILDDTDNIVELGYIEAAVSRQDNSGTGKLLIEGGEIYTLERFESFIVSWEGSSITSLDGSTAAIGTASFQLQFFLDGRFYILWGDGVLPEGVVLKSGLQLPVTEERPKDVLFSTKPDSFNRNGNTLMWPSSEIQCFSLNDFPCVVDEQCPDSQVCDLKNDSTSSRCMTPACSKESPCDSAAGEECLDPGKATSRCFVPQVCDPAATSAAFQSAAGFGGSVLLFDPAVVVDGTLSPSIDLPDALKFGAAADVISDIIQVDRRGYINVIGFNGLRQAIFAQINVAFNVKDGVANGGKVYMNSLPSGDILVSWEDVSVCGTASNFQIYLRFDGRVEFVYGSGFADKSTTCKVRAGFFTGSTPIDMPVSGSFESSRMVSWATDESFCFDTPTE